MKLLLLITFFGRLGAGARNVERGGGAGGDNSWSIPQTSYGSAWKTAPATWDSTVPTSGQWYTPTLPAWTPSQSWSYSKSESCPAQITIIKTQITTLLQTTTSTIYTGSVEVITDTTKELFTSFKTETTTTTTTTTVPTPVPCDTCTTTTTTTTTVSPSSCTTQPICGGGTTYMNFTTSYITSGCCNCTAPPTAPVCPYGLTCTSCKACPTCTSCPPPICTTCNSVSTTTTTTTSTTTSSCPYGLSCTSCPIPPSCPPATSTTTTTTTTTATSCSTCSSCTPVTTTFYYTTTLPPVTYTTTLPPVTYTSTVCCNQTCPTAPCETILSGLSYRRSEAYGQLEVIQSHTSYALPILILLILFGLLTLLALAWLIWKLWPRRKKGTCAACGRGVRECICGT